MAPPIPQPPVCALTSAAKRDLSQHSVRIRKDVSRRPLAPLLCFAAKKKTQSRIPRLKSPWQAAITKVAKLDFLMLTCPPGRRRAPPASGCHRPCPYFDLHQNLPPATLVIAACYAGLRPGCEFEPRLPVARDACDRSLRLKATTNNAAHRRH